MKILIFVAVLIILMFCATVYAIDCITKRQQWVACISIALATIAYDAFCFFSIVRLYDVMQRI